MDFVRSLFWVVAFSALLWAIVQAQNPTYQQDSAWHPPAEAAGRVNPLAQKPEAAAGGRKLFQRNCVECHGEDGSGVAKKHAADLQLSIVQEQTDGTLFWKVTNGNPDRGMPPFSRLPELQRWQIVLYLRSLNRSDPKPSPR